MFRFSFPSTLLDRLSRLHLATDDGAGNTATNHIHLQLTSRRLRFTATNGMLLVALVADLVEPIAVGTDVVLDTEQFTAAMKSMLKVTASVHPVQVLIEPHEVRFTRGQASALVRRIGRTFPAVDHVFSKPAGMRWVPCTSSLDPHLTGIAQRIAGKTPLLFSSPVPVTNPAPQLWQPLSHELMQAEVRLVDLQGLVRSPAYYADSELAAMLMPVTRGGTEKQLDLGPFILANITAAEPKRQPAIAAA
jgi:hypothetical protein